MGFPGGSVVKNLPAMQWNSILGQEDPLEEEMTIHSSILVWRIPWTGQPGGLQSMGLHSQTQLSMNNSVHYSNKHMRACALSCFSNFQLFATLWTVACQAPLSRGFCRQKYWSGLSFPLPGESSWPRDQTCIYHIFCIGRQVLYHVTTYMSSSLTAKIMYLALSC